MKYFKKLVGDRIYLSPMNIEDTEQYVKWLNDFRVTDGVGHGSHIINIESEKKWMEETTNEQKYCFAIIKLENDELIGNCGIDKISFKDRIGTLGIFIGEEENRNKGYGSETLRLLLDYGFNYLNLNNIDLCVKSFNERAINCYKKVGFKEYGRRKCSYYLNGKYYDDVLMQVLKEEFNEEYIRNKNV